MILFRCYVFLLCINLINCLSCGGYKADFANENCGIILGPFDDQEIGLNDWYETGDTYYNFADFGLFYGFFMGTCSEIRKFNYTKYERRKWNECFKLKDTWHFKPKTASCSYCNSGKLCEEVLYNGSIISLGVCVRGYHWNVKSRELIQYYTKDCFSNETTVELKINDWDLNDLSVSCNTAL